MTTLSESYILKVLFAPARRLDATTQRLCRLSAPLFDTYRPELHYMRGPGPKWRAKHER
jgi:hypothetical protein